MLGGEAFVDVSEDVARAHWEAEQAAVQAELDALPTKDQAAVGYVKHF